MQNIDCYTADNLTINLPNKINNDITKWTLDSGTSYHITGNVNNLVDSQKHEVSIHFANNHIIKSKIIGKFVGYINGNKITLNIVLYIHTFKKNLLSIDHLSNIHTFKKNLLSIDHLSNENFKTVFYRYKNKNHAAIFNNKNKRIYTSISNNSKTYKVIMTRKNINMPNRYTCNNLEKATEDNNMELWHRRMGHFNINLKINYPKLTSVRKIFYISMKIY